MKKTLIALLCVAMMLCLAVSAMAGENGAAVATANKTEVRPGDTIEMTIALSGAPTDKKAVGIELTLDDSALEFTSGEWLLTGGLLTDVKLADKKAAFASTSTVDPNCDVFKLTLTVKANALPGTYDVVIGGSVGAAASKIDVDTVQIKVICDHVWATTLTNTDAANHYYECTKTGCTEKKDVAPHVFDNACDTTCDTCGYTRTTEHQWNTDYTTDAAKHWIECKECHVKKDGTEAAHAGGTATCKAKAVCATCNKEYGELAAHKAVEVVADKYLKSEANCVSKAVYYKSCEVCGSALTDTFESGEKNANKHADAEPVFKGAEPATCEKDGKTGDKHCGACDAKLADSEPILGGHKLTKVEAQPADCQKAGNVEYYKCERDCGKYYKDDQATEAFEKNEDVVIEKTAHKTTLVEAVASDCKTNGHIAYYTCDTCDAIFADAEGKNEFPNATDVIAPLGAHKLTKVEKVDSTTTKTGTEAHYKCDVCGKLYKDAEGKTEINDLKEIEIAKKPAGSNPQTGANVAIIVVAVVGTVATIPAVVSKKR